MFGHVLHSNPRVRVLFRGLDAKHIRQGLSALAGRSVPTYQKPSIGCNIKWKDGDALDYRR